MRIEKYCQNMEKINCKIVRWKRISISLSGKNKVKGGDNMTQEQRPSPRQRQRKQRRGAAVAAVVCFVAAIAIVGTYTFKDYRQSRLEKQMAQAEEIQKSTAANTDQIVNEPEDEIEEEVIVPEVTDERTETAEETSEPEEAEATAGKVKDVKFTDESKLLWPVSGNVLMNYSMDKTVYFSTLDQYKYNPALVIAGAEGDQVISSAPGIVKSIDKTAETGTTVNVDLGNGYELFYGQLKEVPVKVGDHVEGKTVLGYVSQPTKYYSVEGSNVYFAMRKNGQPVNPMEYLVE